LEAPALSDNGEVEIYCDSFTAAITKCSHQCMDPNVQYSDCISNFFSRRKNGRQNLFASFAGNCKSK